MLKILLSLMLPLRLPPFQPRFSSGCLLAARVWCFDGHFAGVLWAPAALGVARRSHASVAGLEAPTPGVASSEAGSGTHEGGATELANGRGDKQEQEDDEPEEGGGGRSK